MRRTLLFLLLAAAGCRGKSSSPAPEASSDPRDPPAPPALRLPDVAAPTSYRASLELDPASDTFRGHVEIAIDLHRDNDLLWLNAQALHIQLAVLRQGGADTVLTSTVMPRNFVALQGRFAQGPASLIIDYSGEQGITLSHGMRRRDDGADHYLITQFEPDGARRVFPCFDEPAYKVPWTLDLTVPAADMALTNTPVASEEALPDGKKRLRFEPTPPLPSYLIAVAVGPFEAVDAGMTRGGAPMRIIVPRGRSADAAYAAAETGKIVAALEDYTGLPYPYAKLDQLAVPNGQGGAMENPGLITYGAPLLIIPPGETANARRQFISIGAHELGHQWFGDLVTMRWWDDLWLNEAFATWISPKIMATVHPEMEGEMQAAGSRATALDADALSSARRIRQPIVEEADIGGAFDGITYQKGASVIQMFETWLGPDTFQKGARLYLQRHANGNATAADFLSALDEVSGRDVTGPFGSFLDQTGAPLVDVKLVCPATGPAVVQLLQQRHLARGATRPPGETTWKVPVCVAVPGVEAPRCMVLDTPTGEVSLGVACPAWLDPNAGGVGYYRPRLDADLETKLVTDGWATLGRTERVGAVNDLVSLVVDGDLPVGVLLGLLVRLGTDPDLFVVEQAAGVIQRVAPLVSPAQQARFARLVAAALGDRATQLTWTATPGESVAAARVRGLLLGLAAVYGNDAAARTGAVALTRKWLDDHTAVPESLWGAVLSTAVQVDAEAIPPARAAAEPDARARRIMYLALARAADPAVYGKRLALLLEGDAITPESIGLLRRPDTAALQGVEFDFVRDHVDELVKRTPADFQSQLVTSVCDAARRDEVVAFLDKKLAPIPEIGSLRIAQTIEAMDQCIAEHAALGPDVERYLDGNP